MTERSFSMILPLHSFILCVATLIAAVSLGCAASHHPTMVGNLGSATSSDAMLEVIDRPGPIALEKVLAANWMVTRGGLINLEHPASRRADLQDGDEPIEIYFYVLRHPKFGTYIVDTGLESGFRSPDSSSRVSWLVKTAMKMDTLEVRKTTGEWLAEQSGSLAGVFLTHLHLDHIMGLPDIPVGTPVYAGPGEPDASQFMNMFSSGSTDRLLDGLGALREWPFESDPADRFAGVIDVFGDGSLWALHVPGHTPGSTAFLVRTLDGPNLLLGDATHTRWGWENGVEPGSFSLDREMSAESLQQLLDLSQRFPRMKVHPGHQGL